MQEVTREAGPDVDAECGAHGGHVDSHFVGEDKKENADGRQLDEKRDDLGDDGVGFDDTFVNDSFGTYTSVRRLVVRKSKQDAPIWTTYPL